MHAVAGQTFLEERSSFGNHRFGCLEETLLMAQLTPCNVWRHEGNHNACPRHRHSAMEMNLVVSGRGSFEVEGRRHPLAAGSLLWVCAGEGHYIEERSDDFVMWMVAAERRFFDSASESTLEKLMFGLGPSGGTSRLLPRDDARALERELERVQRSSLAEFLRAAVAYCLILAWEMTTQTKETAPGAVFSAPLHKALALLDNDTGVSREQLAEAVHVSPERLGRLFQSELGITFISYRNRIRLQRFFEIRRCRGGTLLGACLEAGFGSYAQFHRVYTEQVGMPPSKGLETCASFCANHGRRAPEQIRL